MPKQISRVRQNWVKNSGSPSLFYHTTQFVPSACYSLNREIGAARPGVSYGAKEIGPCTDICKYLQNFLNEEANGPEVRKQWAAS